MASPLAVPQQDLEYMDQPSPTNDSKHLQEDTERAISRAAAEHEERSPEALLNAVCNTSKDGTPHMHAVLFAVIFCHVVSAVILKYSIVKNNH